MSAEDARILADLRRKVSQANYFLTPPTNSPQGTLTCLSQLRQTG